MRHRGEVCHLRLLCFIYISVQYVRCKATQFAVAATNQNRVGRCFDASSWTRSSSATKQHNLVPAVRHRYPAAGKVTVGLASRWPMCHRLKWIIHLRARGILQGWNWIERLSSVQLDEMRSDDIGMNEWQLRSRNAPSSSQHQQPGSIHYHVPSDP